MHIVKLLKRRDAASLIVAIYLAQALHQLVMMQSYSLGTRLAYVGSNDTQNMFGGGGWRNEYLSPIISFVIQIVFLEVIIRLFVWVHPMLVSKRK